MKQLFSEQPLLADMAQGRPIVWANDQIQPAAVALEESGFTVAEALEAQKRLSRFAPFIRTVFPETAAAGGLIESPLRAVPAMGECLKAAWGGPDGDRLFIKLDSHLPVSGSIKARGGFYEVMVLAERLALEAGLLSLNDDYAKLASPEMRSFFHQYSVAVGSTGNLGLSVGLMASALGFQATVHMSADARQWKKDLLRSRGTTVIEYESDYSQAVAAGRKAALADPQCHFVDDESSRDLFLGYTVAGLRLKGQLDELGLHVDAENPLLVYLPCGVGGGPGGVTFGLKAVFGDHVHCCFAEPTQAPAVSLGLISGLNSKISAEELGLSGRTAADGLAVTRPSELVCRAMRHLLDGAVTVPDEFLFSALRQLAETEGLRLEPSALAGFFGLRARAAEILGPVFQNPRARHLVWATGGSLVPPEEWAKYDQEGLSPALSHWR